MKRALFTCVFLFAWALILPVFGQETISIFDSTSFQLGEGVVLSKTSFRGLSVVNDSVIWVSGSRGTFAKSKDNGLSFYFRQLKAYPKSDFRDIEAFDANNAVMMSSGSPAYILITKDGGENWKEVFKDTLPEMFLDAMDFWDSKHGIIVGDPIDKHFVLLETKDGGLYWKIWDSINSPKAIDSEAVFAASGTSLRCFGKNEFAFATGGKTPRLIQWTKEGKWETRNLTEFNLGLKSAGAFSFDRQGNQFIVVGGDYLRDQLDSANTSYLPNYPGISKLSRVKGYRSSVEFINPPSKSLKAIACGTSGVDVLANNAWKTISHESFNVVRKSKKGNAIFLAGSKGKIARLVIK